MSPWLIDKSALVRPPAIRPAAPGQRQPATRPAPGGAAVTGKGLPGQETGEFSATVDLQRTLIRPARKDEKAPRPFPNWPRRRAEAVIWTRKNQPGPDATAAASPLACGPASSTGSSPATR